MTVGENIVTKSFFGTGTIKCYFLLQIHIIHLKVRAGPYCTLVLTSFHETISHSKPHTY